MSSKRLGSTPDDAGVACVSTSMKKMRREPGAVEDSVLRPSPHQMRLLWEYDVKCGHKYMGAPFRRCSSSESPDKPGVFKLSEETMSLVMSVIKNIWKRLSLILEIFIDKEHPALGYRLRVKQDLPIKLSMKQNDQVVIGWKVAIPVGCASEHIYYRSDINEDNQYLGGPVSFCNWPPPRLSNLIVKQLSHGSGRYQVQAETKGLLIGGTELEWDYGKKTMPDFGSDTWFNSKCCTSDQIAKPILKKKPKSEVFQDLCVLCGALYRSNSRKSVDRKAQKKVHFMNSHVDFLGSDWNGLGAFDKNVYQINYDQALLEAERLNRLLQSLHSNAWKVVPACTVMTKKEQAEDNVTVMNTFRKICARLRRVGCVVLRGRAVPSSIEDLMPVRPCRWDRLFSEKDKPKRVYAMKEHDRLDNEEKLQDWCAQDLMMVMNMHHDEGNSSSDDDDDNEDDDDGQ